MNFYTAPERLVAPRVGFSSIVLRKNREGHPVNDARFDLLGMGNAMVDVLVRIDDAGLERLGVTKGIMQLVDQDRAEALYAAVGPTVQVSGGSGANTVAGAAALGSRAAFVGKVSADERGRIYTHDLRALGIHHNVPPAQNGVATGCCLIMVTPDAHRSMSTYLGAGQTLCEDDIDIELVRAARISYFEGYLWDPPEAKKAFRKAMIAAKSANRDVALSLSDPFCVDRWRAEFQSLVNNEVDILFANEDEIKSLYQTGSFEDAVEAVRGRARIAALTRSEKGSVIVTERETITIAADPVSHLTDTTGAGDLYAAGFLHGLSAGMALDRCGALGSMCAAAVITHIGARPQVDLAALASERFKAVA